MGFSNGNGGGIYNTNCGATSARSSCSACCSCRSSRA